MAGDATIREARDIISRWSSNDLLDRITSLPAIPEMSSHSPATAVRDPGKPEVRRQHISDAEEDGPAAQDQSGHYGDRGDNHEPDDATIEAMGDDFDTSSRSILEEIDKLAQRARLKTQDDDDPSKYLKLTEIDRPDSSEPMIDVSRLYSQQQGQPDSEVAAEITKPPNASTEDLRSQDSVVSSNAQPESSTRTKTEHVAATPAEPAEPGSQEPATSGDSSGKESIPETDPAVQSEQPPRLSDLLKESRSESVGQLAWWNLSERRRRGRKQEEAVGSASESKSDPAEESSHSEGVTGTASQDQQAAQLVESMRSDQSTQLASAILQPENPVDVQGEPENAEPPENLTTSAQSAQKLVADDFSATQSEEVDDERPIQPKELRDVSELDELQAGSDRQRVAQPRRAQRRKQRSRNSRVETADSTDVEQKGTKTVSRKYRVDNPNPESVSPAIASDSQASPGSNVSSNANSSGRRFRIDGAEDMDETLRTGDSRTRTQGRSRRRYIDEPHADAIRGPHFQVVSKKRSNVASMTGQFLAYVGVLGLTVGTAIVIYGHFGGVSEYTPTGWLVTTVAQMMLFLGVINLVSGGIEQNNEDVSTRINTLGEQLMRIEQVTEQALKGPKISASRYANPDAAVDESRTRESVKVEK